MPKNLRHIFRSGLIKQRKNGIKTSSQQIKKAHNGKMADYRHIFSDNSYKKHWARAQKFADFCRENNVKKLKDITPNFAQKYLLYERDQHVNGYQGYSASTIGSDALMINHLMIGSEHWKTNQKLQKSKLPGMPKRSTLLAKQRQKPMNSREWINTHPHTYAQYKNQIDTIRAFGLRRRELTGGTSQNGRDGLGDQSLYQTKDGRLFTIVQGKGGKIRWTECRQDLQKEMKQIYHGKIRPISERPKSKAEFRHNLKINQPFYRSFDHNVPTHIHRANYAQHMIKQLNQHQFNGTRQKTIYYCNGLKANGKNRYSKGVKTINLHQNYQIGAY